MDLFISFTIGRGNVAENNELKFHKWKEICRKPLCFTKVNFHFYPDTCTSYLCMEVRNPAFKTTRKYTAIGTRLTVNLSYIISTTLTSNQN
jgi:hypothetical protein